MERAHTQPQPSSLEMGVSSFFLLTGPFSCETPSDPLDQFDVQNRSASWLVGSRAASIEQIAVVMGVIRFLFDFISDLLLAHPPGILSSQKMQELYPFKSHRVDSAASHLSDCLLDL